MAKLSVESTLKKARNFSKKGNVQEARLLYNTILEAFPGNKKAKLGLAQLSDPLPDIQSKAEEQFFVSRLQNIYNSGDYERAFTLAKESLLNHPRNFMILNLFGAASANLGNYDEAEKAFRKVLKLNPEHAHGHNNLGNIYKLREKYDDAVASFARAIKLKPNYAEARINMGTVLDARGEYKKAKIHFERALEINPQLSEAYYNYGNTLRNLGDLDAAIEAYNETLKIKPNHRDAQNNLIKLLSVFPAPHLRTNQILEAASRINNVEFQASLPKDNRNLHIKNHLQELLAIADKLVPDISTEEQQIFRRNGEELNCKRHMDIFETMSIIPKFCFSCFKVQIDVDNIADFLQIYILMINELSGIANTYKFMIELRNNISGNYKALVYCETIKEAHAFADRLNALMLANGLPHLAAGLKRGCSEYYEVFPDFNSVDDTADSLEYSDEWSEIEVDYDRVHSNTPETRPIVSSTDSFSLHDTLVLKNWLEYAKAIEDRSLPKIFDGNIKETTIYNLARYRKNYLDVSVR